MSFGFSQHSLNNLSGVHSDLIKVMERAIEITTVDFGVIDGLRTLAEEKENLANGKTETLHSRHLVGCAVDVMAYIGGKGSWETCFYEKIADAVFQAAAELGIAIVWGGNWKTLKDYGHFELSRVWYPDNWDVAKILKQDQSKALTT